MNDKFKGLIKKEEPVNRKPMVQPSIKDFQTVLSPGNIPGTFQLTVWGLGEDNKMYMWDTKEQAWLNG